MAAQQVRIPRDEASIGGLLATPEVEGTFPGVVVILHDQDRQRAGGHSEAPRTVRNRTRDERSNGRARAS